MAQLEVRSPMSEVRCPMFDVRSPDEKVRSLTWDLGLGTWNFLLAGLLLVCATATHAQDDVLVPPLEVGTLLTFHPICVHFALALTVFGLVLDWAGSWRQHPQWQYAGRLSFFAGVEATGLAVLSGWIEQELPRPASVFDPQVQGVLFYHEYLGYGLLGLFLILAIVRARIHGRLPAVFVVLSVLGLAGLIVQGYLGGELVYRYGAGVRAVQILSNQPAGSEQKKAPEQ
ncbi:MAG: DUF2231 domain-containing protein [Deltaproteobacteria bacterium]|nr:DUF2231 domain-containing protein [Deltaproteobacteria bacterium]